MMGRTPLPPWREIEGAVVHGGDRKPRTGATKEGTADPSLTGGLGPCRLGVLKTGATDGNFGSRGGRFR